MIIRHSRTEPTPDNEVIVPEATFWVTRLEGSIGGVPGASTFVPVRHWPHASSLSYAS